jgi:hypothetical protein
MSYVESLEGRSLLTAAIPGTIYLANSDQGQYVRTLQNKGGLVVGWTTPGERVNYTTQISSAGTFNLIISASSTMQNNVVKLLVDGTNATGNISLPSTGDWNTYKTVADSNTVNLPAGRHVITLVIESGSQNLRSMEWTSAVQSSPPAVISSPPATSSATSPGPVVSPPNLPYFPTSPPPGANGPPIAGTWNQTVDFDFATMTTLDPRLTPHEWWNNGPTAGEGQEESDPHNVVLANGVLNLYARQDNTYGTGWTGALVQTSGVDGNSSIPTFSFLYGYAQATIKVPAGQGLWPAFWLLPESHNDSNGELDVMEMLDANTTTVYSTVHRNGVQEQQTVTSAADLSQGFHTYGVDWEPGSETFYIDGKMTAVLKNTALISNEPARLILDLAVGGSWGGAPNSSTPSPADMQVLDMQVWQH